MKNLATYLTFILLGIFAVSCRKDDDIPSSIPENEKLLKRAFVVNLWQFNYEYNPDKTIRAIDISIEDGSEKYSFEYANGNLMVLNARGSKGIKTCVYTYDADNKITSFKIGNNPVILVDYFDDLNRYVWKKGEDEVEIRLNAAGDLAKFSKFYADGSNSDPFEFVYADTKKGAFHNSKTPIPQFMMYDEGMGALLLYGGGMSYKPLEFFGTENTGYSFNHEYDGQGFITKSSASDGPTIDFEYFKQQ